MYSLLVVDDEELIRQGLLARLAFLGFAFDGIYEASSGAGALEAMEKNPVQIVITDIQMPDMDGLTFILKAKERYPDVKFILLSGYAEFAYAEKAITLGVKAYLLKPISNAELKDAIEKTVEQIEKELRIRGLVSSRSRLLKQQKGYQLEKEVNALAACQNAVGGGKTEQRYPYLAQHCPLAFGGGGLYFGIINIEEDSYENGSFETGNEELLRFSVKNVFYEIMSSCCKEIVNSTGNPNQLYAFFASEKPENLREEVERIFLRMQSLFEKNMDVYLTLGLGKQAESLNAKCAREAKEALKQRLVYERAGIYFYEDMKMLEEAYFPAAELHMLEYYMERRDVEHLVKSVRRIFGKEQLERCGVNYIRIMWVRILSMALRSFRGSDFQNGRLEQLLSGFALVDEVGSADELLRELEDILLSCMEEENVKDANAKNKIKLAMAYMEEHYHENLAINELAGRYDMSPNYFSSMFKKEMNQSAVNFLTEIRVKKAAEYLENTDESVADIARRVGYEDSQYFFRVFKKAMGMTPLMYRKENKK